MTFLPDRCYTMEQVWRLACLPRGMVREALESGDLRAVRRGRVWRVPGSAIQSWLEGLGR